MIQGELVSKKNTSYESIIGVEEQQEYENKRVFMLYSLLSFVMRVDIITDNTRLRNIIVGVTFIFAEHRAGYVVKVGVATFKAFPLKGRHLCQR